MEQTFYWDDDLPQPLPENLQEILKEEAIKTTQRPPRCTCASKPDGGCVC